MASPVNNPLEIVRHLYEQAGRPQSSGSDFGVRSHFEQLLASPDFASQVPILSKTTVDSLANHSLVRYYGMVQDMPNPEYYMGAVKQAGVWTTTKYSDPSSLTPDSEQDCQVWDRRPLLCVPVPGLSPWTIPAQLQNAAESSAPVAADSSETARSSKRGRDELNPSGEASGTGGSTGMDTLNPTPGLNYDTSDTKRPHPATAETSTTQPCRIGGTCAVHTALSSDGAQPAHPEGSCLVYVYDGACAGIAVHDVVEVVGVVSHMPELAQLHWQRQQQQQAGSGSTAMECEGEAVTGADLAAHPPTSQVMRLHAITIRRVPSLLPVTALQSAVDAGAVPMLRSHALVTLASALGNDQLAAEYLLLQLLAKVTARSDSNKMPTGNFVLNISACPAGPAPAPVAAAQGSTPSNTPTTSTTCLGLGNGLGLPMPSIWAQALQAAVAMLAPLTTCLPVTVDALNRVSWAPVRDHDTERTSASPLQLAPGTVLLLDETQLAPGQLQERGVASLRALASVLTEQVLYYDMQYFQQPVPCDVSAVLLTVGRSILKDAVTITVPLHASTDSPAEASSQQRQQPLAEVRAYLAAARQLEFGLSAEASDLLTQHFVEVRKRAQQEEEEAKAVQGQGLGMTTEEFATKLTLARLLALSYGESGLSSERWQQLLCMEHTRQERLRAAAV